MATKERVITWIKDNRRELTLAVGGFMIGFIGYAIFA